MKRTEDFNDFLSDHVNLNPNRYERLKRSTKAVTEYLSQNLDGFRKAERQGSYALRTITRPVDDHEYDADLLLFVDYDQAKEPKDYIDAVYNCLKQNGNYADKIRRSKRCVTIDYAGDFHLDIVPCIEASNGKFICNRVTGKFEITDGTGYRDWFNAKSSETNGNLKLVTRLLKHLRDHKETFTAPSILLTTLIGNAVYDGEGDGKFKTTPDALVTVTNRINGFLQSQPFMPEIVNPALPQESFTRHWDQTKYLRFRDMFARYTERINEAYSQTDSAKSVDQWRGLFGDNFGKSNPKPASATAAATTVTEATRVVTPRKPYAR